MEHMAGKKIPLKVPKTVPKEDFEALFRKVMYEDPQAPSSFRIGTKKNARAIIPPKPQPNQQ
jgi:hypothetical protein